jgi:hypothetical protein
VNGSTTQYVYDGRQAIGEITDGQSIGLLPGLKIDEVIARVLGGAERGSAYRAARRHSRVARAL